MEEKVAEQKNIAKVALEAKDWTIRGIDRLYNVIISETCASTATS